MAKKKKKSLLGGLVTSSDRLIAVDVGTRFIKIAVIQMRKDTPAVTTCDIQEIPYVSARGDISPTQITETLHKLLTRNSISSGSLITLLPGAFVTVKQFDVPSSVTEQIAQIIPFEAEKYIPFALDRAVMDFSHEVIQEGDAEETDTSVSDENLTDNEKAAQETANALSSTGQLSKVTVAAVRTAAVTKFLDLLTLKKFKHHALDISTIALYNAYVAAMEGVPPPAENSATVLVDIGARYTDIIAVDDVTQRFLYTRSFEFGGDTFTTAIARENSSTFEEAEKTKRTQWEETPLANTSELFTETCAPVVKNLERTLKYLVSHDVTPKISNIILTGGASVTPGLAQYLSATTGLSVELFDPFGNLGGPPEDILPPACTCVIGSALRMIGNVHMSFDLLPVDVTKLQEQAIRRKKLAQLAIAAAVVTVVALSAFGANVFWTHHQRNTLVRKVQTLAPKVKQARELETRNERLRTAVEEMEDLTDRKTSWSEVLQTISSCMNSNVWIRSLNVDKKNRLTIDASSIGTAYIPFKNEIAKVPRFTRVEVGSTTKKEQNGINYYDFRLSCDVLPDYRYNAKVNAVQERLRSLFGITNATASEVETAVSKTNLQAETVIQKDDNTAEKDVEQPVSSAGTEKDAPPVKPSNSADEETVEEQDVQPLSTHKPPAMKRKEYRSTTSQKKKRLRSAAPSRNIEERRETE